MERVRRNNEHKEKRFYKMHENLDKNIKARNCVWFADDVSTNGTCDTF